MREQVDLRSHGFVRYVDQMGDDDAIVQAARVSYGKGTKTTREDRGLIRFLLRHRHTTPFEMVEFKFQIKVPMDTWRQWIRHRTASVNEYSTRYSEAIEDMAITLPGEWRLQSGSNKQGSDGLLDPDSGQLLTDAEAAFHDHARILYQSRLDQGVAREQARKDLPLSNYTLAYWKIDLHNLFNFLRLRMDSHAQLEIREFANAIYELIKPRVPVACEAFEDYVLHARTFSRQEMEAIMAAMPDLPDTTGLPGREATEFLQKLGAGSP